MTTMMTILNDAAKMNIEDLRTLNQMLVDQIKDKRLAENLEKAKSFKIGQYVSFTTAGRNPRRVTIVISRIAKGKVYGWENGGSGEWHCPSISVSPV